MNYYEKCLDFYGKLNYEPNYKGVHWISQETQEKRFEILCRNLDFDNHSVVDIGCGYGALYGYFKKEGIKPRYYQGLDMLPRMVESAKKAFPEIRYNFFEYDIREGLQKNFDFIVASGTFNVGLANPEYMYEMLEHFYDHSDISVGINFLSNANCTPEEILCLDYSDFALYNPYKMLSACKKFAETVELITDYDVEIQDFTIILSH
jgi:SAM-dependent methyltransferase